MSNKFLKYLNNEKTLIILIILIIIMSFASPFFLTGGNIINLLIQISINGVMACGMTFALLAGEFDLSIGSVMALTGIIAAKLIPFTGFLVALIISVLCSALMGLLNGLLVTKARLHSFIATLGTMIMFKGIALKVSEYRPIVVSDPVYVGFGEGKLFGIPLLVVVFVIIILISAYILSWTRFGRNVYATGGNVEVARNSGINVNFYKIMIFIICSMTAGVAGNMLIGRLNAANALSGDGLNLLVISGVIVGGTIPMGGVGSIRKSIIGILIMAIITNSLDMLKVYSYMQLAVVGVLIVAIIGGTSYINYRKIKVI